jgi:hypothetical protein
MSYTNEQIELAQSLLDTPKVKLLETIAQLQAEVEALRKDAARYQWLSNYLISDETNEDDNLLKARSPIEFDCVIDTAIAKDTQEQ